MVGCKRPRAAFLSVPQRPFCAPLVQMDSHHSLHHLRLFLYLDNNAAVLGLQGYKFINDWGWPIFGGTLLGAIIIGLGGQYYRYRFVSSPVAAAAKQMGAFWPDGRSGAHSLGFITLCPATLGGAGEHLLGTHRLHPDSDHHRLFYPALPLVGCGSGHQPRPGLRRH